MSANVNRCKGQYILLLCIIVVSFGLRIFLALHGGQFYWPDEGRYTESQKAAREILSWPPQPFVACRRLLTFPEHLGFKIVGLVPAGIERFVGTHPAIPAIFFSFFSALQIGLLWRLARQTGADDTEACWAAFLLASATTFLYYSRHLLPYDLALSFGLGGLIVAVRQDAKLRDAWLCGLLAALTFLTYNGYWTLTILIAGVYLGWQGYFAQKTRGRFHLLLRALALGIGMTTPICLVLLSNALVLNFQGRSLYEFSQTVTQGVFAEGWSLPFEYLWEAEHGILIFWCGTLLACLIQIWRRQAPPRVYLWLGALGLIYGALAFFSVGLGKFVVYGRLSRQLVPFFCLIGAFWLRAQLQKRPSQYWLGWGIGLAIVMQAGYNFYVPLTMTFPEEFRAVAQTQINPALHGTYRELYTCFIYPTPEKVVLPSHTIVWQAPHPLQYRPYQYEAYTPRERQILRTTDIRMRLIYFPETPL